MASTIYKGKNLRFSFNGKTLYHATSCKLSLSTKLEVIATKDTNGTVSTPSNYEWSLNTDALVANRIGSSQNDFMDLIDLQLAGAQIAVEFTTGVIGDFILTGNVYIESTDITAETGNSVTGSFSFKGNGDLTKSVVVAAVPVISSASVINIVNGVAGSFQVVASNGPIVTYGFTGSVSPPMNVSINASTGLISWNTFVPAGTAIVDLVIVNSIGATHQNITFNVT